MMNIAMPLLLIVVLGFCLQGMVNSGYPTMSQFAVGVVDEDGGELVDAFRSALAGEGLRDMLTPVALTRLEAETLIRDGKLAGAVVFPVGYSAALVLPAVGWLFALGAACLTIGAWRLARE